MGSECEYVVPSSQNDPALLKRVLRAESINAAVGQKIANTHSGHRQYLLNGACAYDDLRHLEYCSPETRRPGDLVAADLAGISIVGSVISADDDNASIYRRVGTRHQEGTITTSGYHENYMIPTESAKTATLLNIIDTHIATSIWAWSGIVAQSYELSQKAIGIGTSLSENYVGSLMTHGKKPIARIVREADILGGMDIWSRLEVRACDAPFSPWAIYMKYATSSLVAHLAAHPQYIDESLRNVTLTDPVSSLQQSSQDLTLVQPHKLSNDKTITAIEAQRALAMSAQTMSQHIELQPELLAAIPEWLTICDDLERVGGQKDEHNFSLIANRVEWAARHTILSRKLGHAALTIDRPEAVMLDLIWDRVYPTGLAIKYWASQINNLSAYGSTEAQAHFVSAPPDDTRAKARATLLGSEDHFSNVTWSKLDTAGKTYQLRDSYKSDLPDVA